MFLFLSVRFPLGRSLSRYVTEGLDPAASRMQNSADFGQIIGLRAH